MSEEEKTKLRPITDADREKMKEYREKWIEIGLDCSEIDYGKPERSMTAIYQNHGLGRPNFVWARSPIEAMIYKALLELHIQEMKAGRDVPDRAQMIYQLKKNHIESGRDRRARHIVPEGITPSAYNVPYYDEFRNEVLEIALDCCTSSTMRKNFEKKLRKELFTKEPQKKAINDFLSACYWGQHEWWVPYYRFPEEHMDAVYKKKDSEILAHWETISRNCGWWASYGETTICLEKPMVQSLDERQNLHREDGPAIEFGDGFGPYLLEGHRVDYQLVMRPETQTIRQIDGETNGDIRAIRIQRFGWVRYLKESGAKCIDRRHNEIENTKEALMEAPSGEKRLIATCPTGRTFAMGVPPTVNTCLEAQQWLAGPAVKSRVLART